MEFNDQHLVIINSLKPNEASAFVKFLEWELKRHHRNITEIQLQKALFDSEILRHRQDIIEIQELINRVILKFGEEEENKIFVRRYGKGAKLRLE